MGEAFVNASGRDDIRAYSAGVSPGGEVLPGVVEVMKELEISMEGQRPKALTEQMMQEADVIVATCDEVCVAIPKGIEKEKRVEKWKVPAPTGTLENMRAVRDQVKGLTDELFNNIKI